MEEQNFLSNPPDASKNKNKYWKFVVGFLAIIILFAGGYFVWDKYLSPQAKLDRQNQENYEKYLDWREDFEEAMKNDIYGGKTPEETLKMFIDALKKDDVELASKYFMLRSDGSIDPKWLEGLEKTKQAGELQEVADLLLKAKPDIKARAYDKDFKFAVRENGELKAYIDLEFNEISGVWKIESL